jgi:hypothetical protein
MREEQKMPEENDEREFLHDLASPLGTALYIADAILDSQGERGEEGLPEFEELKQLFCALQKMKTKMAERRETLIRRGVPSRGVKHEKGA